MSSFLSLLSRPIGSIGDMPLTAGHLAGVILAMLAIALLALWLAARSRANTVDAAAERARDADVRLAEIARAQAEMQGRMATIAEVFGTRQSELNRALSERLDAMTGRIGRTMTEQTRSTHESLSRLQERLAVIDQAQGNIQSLAGQVVQLQQILSNKQTRGAFGQSRMEAIVADGLPAGSYEFQATLSNGNRPDCLVKMPNGAPSLVIDAKFPLESWNAIRAAAESESAEAAKLASQAFRRDMEVHVRAIAEKYFISGETQDTAFMFVPSESVFAEIHENFEAVVQRAHRSRIVIVSPSLLMLSIQVVQAVLKDARMREQAHLIQGEVIRLMEDVSRLDERVRRLQGHFAMTQKDIDQILTSTDKVARRGQKIEALEFGDGAVGDEAAPDDAAPRVAETTSGKLRLRLVDGEE